MNTMNYCIQLDEDTELFCSIHLFTMVKNTAEIRRKIMNGQFSCCAIKPSLVTDYFHVIVAANKAAVAAKQNRLITRSVYTEILFNLSMSKNITRSLTEFSIDDNSQSILMIFLHTFFDVYRKVEIMRTIDGHNVPVTTMQHLTNVNLVEKIYKIEEDELQVSDRTDSIVSRISCKEFI